MAKILIKFPSRERPQKFRDCLANIIDTVSSTDEIMVVATLDSNDTSMKWADGIDKPFFKAMYGESNNKIHAVNRDMSLIKYKWDYCVLMSDDMLFMKKDWDLVIDHYFHIFSEGKEKELILHFPTDQVHGERIITMPIFNRKWYDRWGYVYHPSYQSLFCDDEQTMVSKMTGSYRKINEQIAVHLHPILTGAKPDDLLIKTQSLNDIDQKNFEYRKSINFGI
jgi:chromosome condensin MukBEF ATPase and DNA-binding subunit MukB